MVTITKDNDTKVVTMGAYENFYRKQGFEIVREPKPIKDAKIIVDNTKSVEKTTRRSK